MTLTPPSSAPEPHDRPTPLAWLAVAVAALGFVACLALAVSGGASVDIPWAPSLGIRLELAFDGLGALYALLATGIGLAVFAYGAGYLPIHLHHAHRPARDDRRFWPWMLLFMGAMVVLACAQDLIVLFVAFDLTAVASYFLIGFDRERREARGAAMMALLVTVTTAVLMLMGAVLLYADYGTFSLPDLYEVAAPGTATTVATLLIAIAALAKSAQVPLHFWLPRAMEAPTPVSAYLHSAAMVAAGVLVIGRIHPLLALDPLVLDALLVVGFASIVVGGLLSLAQDELKQVLAYSTISQYGYVVVLYGIGGPVAAGAAAFYVIAHAIAKSALFMTAGTVILATDETRLSRLGGLARPMPVLAVASGVAAATLAALPLTIGFFKDELFFAATAARGDLVGVMAVVAAALTVAYIARFWLGLFAGPTRIAPHATPRLLLAPIVVLAAVGIVGGLAPDPFARLAEAAGSVTAYASVALHPAYHLDTRIENLMALVAWLLGAGILLAVPLREPVARAVADLGMRFGPRRWYGALLVGLARLSDAIHAAEVRDLRSSVAAVLVPTGVLVGIGFLATLDAWDYQVGGIGRADIPVVVLLALAVGAALTVTRDPGRLRPVLALSVLGFALAAAYAVMAAPDVALVALLVEAVYTLVFVAVFAVLPRSPSGARADARRASLHPVRDVMAGVIAGVGAFVTIWAALSREPAERGDALELLRLAPQAHGGDVVTVILADFRGLDTMVEITVLAVAVVGATSLLRRGRSW
ncbi:MAG: hydrogen gas-evolving membrane-bound hydrogenase subunit E [Chloroflexota bacterium]